MFRWIVNLLRRRQRKRQRSIFRYFDGQRLRSVDPLEVEMALELHPTFNWDDYALLQQGDADTAKSYVSAICDVFNLQKWDPETETGLTIEELLAVLGQYLEYCDAVKKNISAGPTSPPATAPSPSCAAPAVPSPTTNCSSVCT